MRKVKYPNGKVRRFMWIKGNFGYNRYGSKIYRYPLPIQNKNKKNRFNRRPVGKREATAERSADGG